MQVRLIQLSLDSLKMFGLFLLAQIIRSANILREKSPHSHDMSIEINETYFLNLGNFF